MSKLGNNNSEECFAELEMIESAYPGDVEVLSVENGCTFKVSLGFLNGKLRVHVPFDFPCSSIKLCIDGNMRSCDRTFIVRKLACLLKERPDVGAMEVCIVASEQLEAIASASVPGCGIVNRDRESVEETTGDVRIARFLIYFHHIMR